MQAAHAFAPAVEPVPGAQAAQLVAPGASAKRPAAHGVQLAAPAAENVPGAHRPQTVSVLAVQAVCG
jgi:hypothetical protein